MVCFFKRTCKDATFFSINQDAMSYLVAYFELTLCIINKYVKQLTKV